MQNFKNQLLYLETETEKENSKHALLPPHPTDSVRPAGQADSLKLSTAGEPGPQPLICCDTFPHLTSIPPVLVFAPKKNEDLEGVHPWVFSTGRSSVKAPVPSSQQYDPDQLFLWKNASRRVAQHLSDCKET